MITFIVDKFYYLFLGLIVLSLVQRHRGKGNTKRTATVFQAILVFIIYIGAMVIQEEGFENKWISIPLAVVALALYLFRPRILPYKLNCRNCGTRLTASQIFMHDSNLCAACDPDEQTAEDEPEDQNEEAAPDESVASEDETALPGGREESETEEDKKED